MDPQSLYPLTFHPILRRLIWGGRRLGTVLRKPIGDGPDYAESWELSDHRDQVSVVDRGPLAGTTLRDLLRSRPLDLLGPAIGVREQFPLLVKFIDANQDLSVQVHPDDERGRRLADDNGKTETWVVVDAAPGSRIYAGLRRGVGRDEFLRALGSDEVLGLLHHFRPGPGDSLLIEAGTVHAIGAGVLVAEIQQMSDATFRVYDWGRVGPDGRPRPLHVEQALACIDFDRGPVDPLVPESEDMGGAGARERLSRTRYFALDRLRLRGPTRVGRRDRFTILMGLGGDSVVSHDGRRYPLAFGQSMLLPASIGECEISPEGESVVLTVIVP